MEDMHAQCRGYDLQALANSTCPVCLGLFAAHESFPTRMQAMLVDLQEQIQACRFAPSSFCCVISFPASLFVLCNAAGFEWRSHFSASKVKELIREYFEAGIAEFMHAAQDIQETADLLVEITISLQHETDVIAQLCEACDVPVPVLETRKKYNPQEKKNEYTTSGLTNAQMETLWEKMNSEQRAKSTAWLKRTRETQLLQPETTLG